jgi:hypothetical protein
MSAADRALALLVLVASAVTADVVAAQTVRASGSTTVRYIELRPFVLDSVAQSSTAGDGLLRQLADGRIVRCIPGEEFCRDVRPGVAVSVVPVIQDLEVSAWGFGRGLHALAQIRGRSDWGGDARIWPQSDDRLEVMSAYVEIERPRYRARAGRQWRASGLGFFNFDGLSVSSVVMPGLQVELYGGRSLVRGLNDSRTGGALEAIEALAPPSEGILTGVQARYRLGTRAAFGAAYQVDVRSDRLGLYSELASAEAIMRVGAGLVEGAIQVDVAGGAISEARLHARSAPVGRFVLHGELRRHRPYFETWTIWGAFSPLGFDEARGGATWAEGGGKLILRGEATYRRYGSEGRDETVDVFRHRGHGAAAGATWVPKREWRVDGGYRVESGFGAARRDGSIGVSRRFGDNASLGVNGVLFQRLYEFRLDEATVAGLGIEASAAVAARARLFVNAATYRHVGGGGGAQSGLDWNQRRASLRLQWTIGGEPELTPEGRPAGER